MNVGSLFSGIGGFDLGLERAGMRVAWQCEADEFCQRVLAKHWPNVPCYPDVRELHAGHVEPVDVLCGGFPCQDISVAGRGAGIDGERSGLWAEYARLVGELRPRYVVVENVSALLARGLGRVLGDLAALGYDAEWDCLPASAFGAPHRRDRVWLVAYPSSEGRWEDAGGAPSDESPDARRASEDDHVADGDGEGGRARHVADADGARQPQPEGLVQQERGWAGDGGEQLADADAPAGAGERAAAEAVSEPGEVERSGRRGGVRGDVQDADERTLQPWRVGGRVAQAGGSEWWAVEPAVGRVAHGVPDRLDQLAALGNALVPQIAEWIGRRILEHERGRMSLWRPEGGADA